jgi:sialic acid synthase SpsE
MTSVQIIAEIGNTHEGSVGLAKCFITSAAHCGVDAVKFQVHIFDEESLPNAPNPPYFKDETREEYFNRTAFTVDQWKQLRDHCEAEGVEFLASPFSEAAVDLLEDVGVASYKIPSGEVTNLPLLEKIATLNKPVLLSSGMSSWNELDAAFATLKDNGCKNIIVLQCTSAYPCPPEKAGLNVLDEMAQRYKVPVGFSDHTFGSAIPIAAVLKGAVVIEKHFTLSQDMYGSDAKHSTLPEAFKQLVDDIRAIETAFAHPIDKDAEAAQLTTMKETFEKSIVTARNLPQGHTLKKEDLSFKKPGIYIPVNQLDAVLGKTTTEAIKANTPLQFDQLN